MNTINHARTVKFTNFRTGDYSVYPGDVWSEYHDGPINAKADWYTLVPIRRDGELVPTRSQALTKEVANQVGEIVKSSETWEQARAAIEHAFPGGFPGMKY